MIVKGLPKKWISFYVEKQVRSGETDPDAVIKLLEYADFGIDFIAYSI